MSDKDIGKQVASLGLIKKLVPLAGINVYLRPTHHYLGASLVSGNTYYALVAFSLNAEVQWCDVGWQCSPTVVGEHLRKHVVVDGFVGHSRSAGQQKQQRKECED